MLLSRNAKIIASSLLVLSLAACSTTKKADEAAAAQAAAEQQAAADKAAADAARASAANTGSGVDSQSLADANAKAQADAASKANSLAATLGVKVFHFDYDSSSVASSDYNALKAHAAYLSKNPGAKVQVGGHTDERGTREYNMALGERRAKSVAAFLTSNGAKSSQLEVISYGEEKPVATGESDDAWAQNRRVELEYTSGNP
ncbi:MAG: peptidoglycan-associated lipoprotein Pal [Pedobacter sp.]|nr:peptidoglycan-associated lipoprotein Pal [Pedobacter sp.]